MPGDCKKLASYLDVSCDFKQTRAFQILAGRANEGEKDIHEDYGDFCYKGFRHLLCHGWASGVLAFVYEYMLGLKLADVGNSHELKPHPLGVKEIHAKIPTRAGWLLIDVVDANVNVNEM